MLYSYLLLRVDGMREGGGFSLGNVSTNHHLK